MTVAQATLLTNLLGLYFGFGLIFALVFVVFLAGRIDPAAKGMPARARAIILPGVMLLWPLMLAKAFTQREPPVS